MINKAIEYRIVIYLFVIIFIIGDYVPISYQVKTIFDLLYLISFSIYFLIMLLFKKDEDKMTKFIYFLLVLMASMLIYAYQPQLFVKDLADGEQVEELFIANYDKLTGTKGSTSYVYIIKGETYTIVNKSITKEEKNIKENIQNIKKVTYLKHKKVILKVE